ncbi:MAG: hypothetical protein IPK82_38850 [Polyangiaceae bacterium]|nr:hypothetical protein [Polyangiaceae bacterium]
MADTGLVVSFSWWGAWDLNHVVAEPRLELTHGNVVACVTLTMGSQV